MITSEQLNVMKRGKANVEWNHNRNQFQAKPRPEIDAAEIMIGLVCSTSGVSRAALLEGGKRKSAKVANARAEAAYMMRRMQPQLSYPIIAKVMNWNNHTSALRAERKHLKLTEQDHG